MSIHTQPTPTDVKAWLDELFQRRVALASLAQERNAAILRQLPPEWRETIAATMQEFTERQEHEEAAEEALANQIRLAGKTLGMAIEGTYLHMTHTPGRRQYDFDALDRLGERIPEVAALRHQGEPIVAIRARAQRSRRTPLLYDMHGIFP